MTIRPLVETPKILQNNGGCTFGFQHHLVAKQKAKDEVNDRSLSESSSPRVVSQLRHYLTARRPL